MRELKILLSVGVNPMLYVDELCPVTTPYDKMHNRQRDRNCGHGTCGVGVGATVEREESMASLLAGDLCSRFVFESKLASVERHYDAMYGKSMKIVRKGAVTVVRMADPRVIPVSVDEFYEALAEMVGSPHIRLVRGIPDSSAGKNRVFEGSQGLMLDPRIGVFPHVTRTRTGTENVLRLHADPTVFVVTRAYLTRHGAGPMPNDGMPHNISTNPDETNANNAWQGEFRRALLDVDTLKYAIGRDEYIRSAHKKVLVVTCLDHVRGDYRYTRGGEIVQNSCEEEFVKGISDYLGFGVVYVSDGPVACDVRSFKTRE
jgi:adenylosuccinate synthase